MNVNVKHILPIALGAAIAGAVVFYLWSGLGEAKYVLVPVKKADLNVEVKGSGRLEAAQSTRITMPLWWKAITWLVPEGATVKKDEIIVKLERKDLEDDVRTASADYAVALAKLEEARQQLAATQCDLDAKIKSYEADLAIAELELKRLKGLPRPDDIKQREADLRRAKAEFEVAKEEYQRMFRYRGQGYTTETELRKMMSTMKEAESAFIRADSQLRVMKMGATPDDIREAELKLEQARIALKQTTEGLPDTRKQLEAAVEKQAAQTERTKTTLDTKQKDLDKTELRAPTDGMVVYRAVEGQKVAKGSKAWRGCAIMDLPDLSKIIVKTKVREDYIHLVKVGQKVIVHVDALPVEEFYGKVSEVGKVAKDKSEGDIVGFGDGKRDSGIRIFDVTVTLDKTDKRFAPNLIARLQILVDDLPGVLVIPKDAVKDKGGKKTVMLAKGPLMKEQPVVLGLEAEDLVQVKSGLKEGESVCLSQERRKEKKPSETAVSTEATKP